MRTHSWSSYSRLLTVDPQIPGQPPVEHVTPDAGLLVAGRFHAIVCRINLSYRIKATFGGVPMFRLVAR
jgi:hypothetical protein